MNKKQLRKDILMGVCALTVLIVVSVFFSFKSVKRNQALDNERVTKVTATNIYHQIGIELAPLIAASRAMSCDTFLLDALHEESSASPKEMEDMFAKYLAGVRKEFGEVTPFLISDASKRYYSYDGLYKVLAPETDEYDRWYSIFADGRKEYDITIDLDQVNDDSWSVFVNCRMEDENGKLCGVCGIGTEITGIQQVMCDYENANDVEIHLVNKDGDVQVDANAVNIKGPSLYDIQYGELRDYFSFLEDDGTCVVTKYVEDLGWYLVVRNENESIMSYLIPMLKRNFIVWAAITALYVAACCFCNKKILLEKNDAKILKENHKKQ